MDVNLVAVLVAAIISIVLGMIWYAPPVFGRMWMQATKMKKDDMKGSPVSMAGMIVTALLLAYVLGHVVRLAQAATPTEGALIGFWMWAGFIVTTNAAPVLFEKKPAKAYIIYMVYQLVALLLMGAVFVVL